MKEEERNNQSHREPEREREIKTFNDIIDIIQ